MNSPKQIGSDIDTMKAMGEFISAYEEIAANNMRRVRDAVIKRRGFLEELTKLYNDIKTSYKMEVERLTASKKGKGSIGSQFSLLKKNNKTVCVLFSTNASFYGDIVPRTYALFKDSRAKSHADVVIIGRAGRRIFEQYNPGAEYTYFDYPDTKMDPVLLKPIILHIAAYERVVIFHTQFQTLVNQMPMEFVISESKVDVPENEVNTKYIFEPSLEEIIEYFEKEIFGAIFEQSMHESQLSKLASRMVTLDTAVGNIKKRTGELNLQKRLLEHQVKNKQQANEMSRIVMLRRR
jgi:F-type H+-transporting ATPase subunit gamma